MSYKDVANVVGYVFARPHSFCALADSLLTEILHVNYFQQFLNVFYNGIRLFCFKSLVFIKTG